MSEKIVTFQNLIKRIEPHTVTLVSGSFEPFNEYYFRLLKWGSKQGEPFVVIVQKDDMVLKRRGFLPLSSTHKTRAEIIAALTFVDYVIVANKTAHDEWVIQSLMPKIIVFQRDNIVYRKVLAKEIKHVHPEIMIKYAPFKSNAFVSFYSTHQFSLVQKSQDKIVNELIRQASLSSGKLSKISAILIDGYGKILFSIANNDQEEHAEILLLRMANANGVRLDSCMMYILVPPCLMCAREIASSAVRNIWYIYPYGEGDGIKFLKKLNILVRRYQY